MKLKIPILILAIILIVFPGLAMVAIPQQEQNHQQSGQSPQLYVKGSIENIKGQPIKKASIILPELSLSAESDESGRFALGPLPPGKYHLEVHADNYMTYISDPLEIVANIQNYQIILSPKIEEQIVVTATRTPKRYAETPVKTEVISKTRIEQKVAANLAESLSLTPGIRVENDCQNCNFTQVRINGMEGKYTQILINGLPVVSAMTGVYGLEQIPAGMIEQIEIVKGGGSALYGGNAVAGVVNVITREPGENRTDLKVVEEAISSEPHLTLNFNTSHVSRDMNTRTYLFANYQKRNPVDLNQDSFSELGSINNTSFGLNLFHDFQAVKAKAKFEIFKIFEDRRGGNLFDRPCHETDVCEWIKSDQLGLSAEWNQALKPNLFYNLSFSYLDAKRDTYYGSHQDPKAYGSTKNPLLIGNGQMNWQAGVHLLSFGFQLRRDKIKDQALGYNRIIDQTYDEVGIFIQDDWKISKTLSLLGGLRLNKHTALNNVVFTPRVSLLANLTRDLTWRTTISTGFRAPQVFDEDLHITQVGGVGMMIVNSPALKEENSSSLTTGFDFGRQSGRYNLQLSLEGFYTRLADAFILHEISGTENTRLMERINGSGAKVYGVSAVAGLSIGQRVVLNSGWTIQNNLLDEPEPEFNSKDFFRTPKSYGYASLEYKNERWLNAELSLEYTGSMKVPHYAGYILSDLLETTDPFWVVNLKLNRKVELKTGASFNFLAGIFNLFDSYQKDLDLGADRDSGYVYGPSKPRSFYAGLEYSF
ncbi:MAG TPA: TonB-dependent receptor [Candidatus Saccharicenans sp.]|jgi:outer membrane receptor for ferrienterochelin and colicins|nr:TonB-dependent receptor [Candidatus Saccharicenans sp.]HRD02447.1 TonB-dependent receptor [Candidatus Saccharicenans sp.]